jgi:hypothetical protein
MNPASATPHARKPSNARSTNAGPLTPDSALSATASLPPPRARTREPSRRRGEDRDALGEARGLERARGDGDVVEEAEAHHAIARGVVAGRAHERDARRRLAARDLRGEIDRGARGAERGVDGDRAGARVGVEDRGHAARALDRVDERGVVRAEELVPRGGARLALDERQRGRVERTIDRAQPARRLGV